VVLRMCDQPAEAIVAEILADLDRFNTTPFDDQTVLVLKVKCSLGGQACARSRLAGSPGRIENMFHYSNQAIARRAAGRHRAQVGTPAYVYSSAAILENYRAYDEALGDLPHAVCYAVKANSSLGILALLAKAGAGFDIVSGGELYRVMQAGGDPSKVVFSGVGKTAGEVDYALESGIHMFNCESEPELALIDALAARRGVKAGFAIRVNPDVDASTHPYISTGLREHKFGIDIADAEAVYERARDLPNLAAEGVSCHIGSQLMDTNPILEAIDRVLALVERLRAKGFGIRHIDLGGGLGVAYQAHEQAPEIRGFHRAGAGEAAGPRIAGDDRAGPLHRGPRGRAADARAVPQEERGKGIRDRGRGHERPDPARALPLAPRDYSAAQDRAAGDRRGRGGAGLRDRRFSGARAQDGQRRAGRLPGGRDGGGVRVRAVVELQLAAARAGDPGGGRYVPHDSGARDVCGPGARGDRMRLRRRALALRGAAAWRMTPSPPSCFGRRRSRAS
jgi:hypothetical protein